MRVEGAATSAHAFNILRDIAPTTERYVKARWHGHGIVTPNKVARAV
jgi:hypothetical protein